MRFLFRPLPLLGALLLAVPAAAQNAPPAGNSKGSPRRQLPPALATRQLDVEIHFSITAGTDPAAKAAAVQVYVSWDSGRNWHLYSEVAPDAGKFRFRAKRDSEFWFMTETVDRAGRPPSDTPKWPQMRLVVDTQKPELQATAAVNPSGLVEMTWSVTDPHLNVPTLKIEYQDARDADGPWEPIAISPSQLTPSRGGLAGRIAFAPRSGLRTVNLRCEIADAAGNKSFFHQQLAIPGVNQPRGRGSLISPLAADAGARRWPSDNALPSSSPARGSPGIESIARPEEKRDADAPEIVPNPHVRRDRLAASPPRQAEESIPPPSNTETTDTLPAPTREQAKSADGPQLGAPSAGEAPPRDEASAQSLPPPRVEPDRQPRQSLSNADIGPILDEEPLPPPSGQESTPGGIGRGPDVTTTDAIPPGTQPRLSNARRFTLDYDVESVSPEGIADVELWGTNDGGRTWLKWGTDPDKLSPMDVEVANEATYGFRVVIVGKNGLEGNKPQSGDQADIWVSIDVTRPAARITAAGYGTGENAGRLDIRWEASDANLGQRPVTLLYSDRPDGKFSVIAAGMENTGQYLWQFDPRSPRSLYLRLEVRDDAGNIAIDQLTDPIHIEGLIPKARIRSLQPAPEPLPDRSEAFQSPLFR
jgi:hypothetical protein